MDHAEVAPDQLRKRLFVAFPDIALEYLGIGGHAFSKDNRLPVKNRTNIPTGRVSRRLGFTPARNRVHLCYPWLTNFLPPS